MDLIKLIYIISSIALILGFVVFYVWKIYISRGPSMRPIVGTPTREPKWITEWETIDQNSIRLGDLLYQRRQWVPEVLVSQFNYQVSYYHCPRAMPIIRIGETYITEEQLRWWLSKEDVLVPIRVGPMKKINLNAEMIKKILILI